MAQYFEVLSQSDGNVEQGGQFFNGNQENEPTQVRYILTDDSRPFPTQQLILSADQVMVVDGSQGVVIDQGQIAYKQTSQPQQYSAVVQSPIVSNQQPQQIYYMEANTGQGSDNMQTVQAVIEQGAAIQPGSQTSTQPQPIVLNHQIGTGSANISTSNRQIIQGAATQRPILNIRAVGRQSNIQVNPQSRTVGTPMRQGLPQQVRPAQPTPVPMRTMSPQVQMRVRTPIQPIRQPGQQPQQRPVTNAKAQMAQLINRQLNALQQRQQQQQQQQPPQQQSPQMVQQPQQPIAQQQQPQSQQVIQQPQSGSQIMTGQVQKGMSEFQRQQQQLKNNEHEELDDHDSSMSSSPNPMHSYKKFLEQRQQIGKNPILARLPNSLKVTSTANQQQQQSQVQPCTITQTIDEVVQQHQAAQQQQVQQQIQQQQSQLQPQQPTQPQPQQHPIATIPQQQANVNQSPHITQTVNPIVPLKKPRASRAKAALGTRTPGAVRQRPQRLPATPQPFTAARIIGPPAGPRFAMNQQQQQPRFANQQQMMQQRMTQQQHQQSTQHQQPPPQPLPQPQPGQQQHTQPPPPAPQQQPQQQLQQNIGNQSQINYLITPPTANRPRQQRPLPAYIPSSQIQQIIESTPIAEEFSDSIRMLVLLENGEQRLITFTLPKEACTIQEILEQVNVPFTPDTNIQVTEANSNGINYIVTVGNVSNIAYVSPEEEPQEAPSPESHPPTQPPQQIPGHPPPTRQMPPQNNRQTYQPKTMPHDQIPHDQMPPLDHSGQAQPEPPKAPTPEPPKEAPPKLIPGKLAVCLACGYTGEDFNRCTRCLRKLPDNVRSIDSPIKIDIHKAVGAEMAKLISSHNTHVSTSTSMKTNNQQKPDSAGKPSVPSPVKKKVSKTKAVEHESVVISSDEEEDEKKPVKSVSEQLLKNLGASISISPVTKEPSLTEIKKHVRKLSIDHPDTVKVSLVCRTIRIGSYRFVPVSDIIIDPKCVIIKGPVIENKSEIQTIRIDRGDIVKVLVCFNKSLPVIFYYLNVGAAPMIRDLLNMKKESGLYYDPVDEKEDSYRKITLLPEDFCEDHKQLFNQIYGVSPYNIMDELTAKEANDILIKTCPKDSSANIGSFSEIKQILLYPKEGQGRLSINTEDYVCLAVDQFLNDKIIDFYLKYLWENLPSDQQKKVHIFSTFFYKRLTTKPTKAARKSHPYESDPTLSAAEKRHHRVKNWTKRINLFDKDFIVVPINENAHWFLAIICFPGFRGPQTFDGKPYKPPPKIVMTPKKKSKKEKPIPCDDPMLSDKDEAESDDSDLESDESDESAAAAAAAVAAPVVTTPPVPVKGKSGNGKVPIKQPCILIFDSLAGPSRSRVVATLRDYLTMEYKSKMDSERVYNRDVIKGASCKVPQQNNFTDCGLYLLQYVEHFFNDPIKDYNIPIKGINNWFEEIVVTKKREDIAKLIKHLMEESGTDTNVLPEIALPTLNGNLVERQESERDPETGEEEQEDMFTDIEDSEMTDTSAKNISTASKTSDENGDPRAEETAENNSSGGEYTPPTSEESSPLKPSQEGISEKDIVTTVMQTIVSKPTLSEFSMPRQMTSNKDTLNYLKSKRIIRHKQSTDGPEFKKSKYDN